MYNILTLNNNHDNKNDNNNEKTGNNNDKIDITEQEYSTIDVNINIKQQIYDKNFNIDNYYFIIKETKNDFVVSCNSKKSVYLLSYVLENNLRSKYI